MQRSLPELPDVKRERFVARHGLSRYDAGVLAQDRAVAEYFEEVLRSKDDRVSAKLVANWVTGELFRAMNEDTTPIQEVKIRPQHLAELMGMVAGNAINQTAAKHVFGLMWQTGHPPEQIVREMGLEQISDRGQLADVVARVVAENPDVVASFKAGKETAVRFLMGQVMKASRGKANPQLVEQLLREQL